MGRSVKVQWTADSRRFDHFHFLSIWGFPARKMGVHMQMDPNGKSQSKMDEGVALFQETSIKHPTLRVSNFDAYNRDN